MIVGWSKGCMGDSCLNLYPFLEALNDVKIWFIIHIYVCVIINHNCVDHK